MSDLGDRLEALGESEQQVNDISDQIEEIAAITGQSAGEVNQVLDALIQHQGEPITFRRICWPDPDRLCLMGGCGDCNKHPFKALGRIKHYLRHAPVEKREGLKEAHTYGLDRNFQTAEVWRGEWPKGVSRK